MSTNFYIFNDTIYEGVRSDIELLLAINSGYGMTPQLIEAKVVRVTPDAVTDVEKLHQEMQAKIEEVKNLRHKLYELTDLKLQIRL